jgi:aspartate/glutamate racemase
MTKLLEQAVNKVKTLSDNEQNAIAALILQEIEDDFRWDKSFASRQDILAMLAEEATDEINAGKSEILDPDKL